MPSEGWEERRFGGGKWDIRVNWVILVTQPFKSSPGRAGTIQALTNKSVSTISLAISSIVYTLPPCYMITIPGGLPVFSERRSGAIELKKS